MRRMAVLLLALVVAGCTKTARPPDTQQPEVKPPVAKYLSVASAAAPASSDEPTKAIIKVVDQVVARLNALPIAEVLQQHAIKLQDPAYILICAEAPKAGTTEIATIACQIGPFGNTIEAHVLFWKENETWTAQLYPQAEPSVARARRERFNNGKGNCPVGCAGGFKALRQQGDLLMAVVDVSSVSAHPTQEVHLLKREEGKWRILWVPTPDRYPFSPWPKVSLPATGIDSFAVTYWDGTKTSWVRENEAYVQK